MAPMKVRNILGKITMPIATVIIQIQTLLGTITGCLVLIFTTGMILISLTRGIHFTILTLMDSMEMVFIHLTVLEGGIDGTGGIGGMHLTQVSAYHLVGVDHSVTEDSIAFTILSSTISTIHSGVLLDSMLQVFMDMEGFMEEIES